MKYVKTLSLLVVAAATLMMFAGTAFAGSFTSPKKTAWTGDIHIVGGELTTHVATTVTCKSSTIEATVTSHGPGVTGKAHVLSLLDFECNQDVTVVNKGTLEFHTHPADPGGETYAIVTSTGATIIINITSIGITCGFKTNETEIGTLTNSTHQLLTHQMATETSEPNIAQTATIHIESAATIPRHSGSIFCGSSGEWTGTWEVTTPDYFDYD